MKNIFRVLLSLLLITAMVFSFAACGDDKNDLAIETEEEKKADANADKTPKGGKGGGNTNGNSTTVEKDSMKEKVAEAFKKHGEVPDDFSEEVGAYLDDYLVFKNPHVDFADGKEAFWSEVYLEKTDAKAKDLILKVWEKNKYPERDLEIKDSAHVGNTYACVVNTLVPKVDMAEVEKELNSVIIEKNSDENFKKAVAEAVKSTDGYEEIKDDEAEVKKLVEKEIDKELIKETQTILDSKFKDAEKSAEGETIYLKINKGKDGKWEIDCINKGEYNEVKNGSNPPPDNNGGGDFA